MTQHEVEVHLELLERIKSRCNRAMLRNHETPEGQSAFKGDLELIVHTAELISSRVELKEK